MKYKFKESDYKSAVKAVKNVIEGIRDIHDTPPLLLRMRRKSSHRQAGPVHVTCPKTGATVPIIPEKIARRES